MLSLGKRMQLAFLYKLTYLAGAINLEFGWDFIQTGAIIYMLWAASRLFRLFVSIRADYEMVWLEDGSYYLVVSPGGKFQLWAIDIAEDIGGVADRFSPLFQAVRWIAMISVFFWAF